MQLTVDFYMIEAKPENLSGDRAYDSDKLDAELREQGAEMIAPHRSNRVRKKTHDDRRLRRYERRRAALRLDSVATSAPRSLGVPPGQFSRLRAACSLVHPAQAVLR